MADDVSPEHLDTQVQKAQEQLLSLKRQQDSIERHKRELEELSLKQEQLQMGRTEMIEKFTRALPGLRRTGGVRHPAPRGDAAERTRKLQPASGLLYESGPAGAGRDRREGRASLYLAWKVSGVDMIFS